MIVHASNVARALEGIIALSVRWRRALPSVGLPIQVHLRELHTYGTYFRQSDLGRMLLLL